MNHSRVICTNYVASDTLLVYNTITFRKSDGISVKLNQSDLLFIYYKSDS